MKEFRPIAITIALAAATVGGAGQYDFLHMPKHTVEVAASQLDGRPSSLRLRGYYMYRVNGQYFILSHRPKGNHNQFIASAELDRGSFGRVGIVERRASDEEEVSGKRLRWSLRTWGVHVNGVSFRVHNGRYLVLDLKDDPQLRGRVPAIFVGSKQLKEQSGSGYVLVDLLK